MTEQKTEQVVETAGVVEGVLPTYEKELTPREERTTKNIVYLLNKHNVKDEIVRGRVLAKSNAFSNDCFNAGVEQGKY